MRYCSFLTATNFPTKHICVYKTEIRHLMTEWPTVSPLDQMKEKKKTCMPQVRKLFAVWTALPKVITYYKSTLHRHCPSLQKHKFYVSPETYNLRVRTVRGLNLFNHIPHIVGCLFHATRNIFFICLSISISSHESGTPRILFLQMQ